MTSPAESWDPFCGMTLEEFTDRNNRLYWWTMHGHYPLSGEHLEADPRHHSETSDRVRCPAID